MWATSLGANSSNESCPSTQTLIGKRPTWMRVMGVDSATEKDARIGVWAQIGVIAKVWLPGARTGPPAARLYALEPGLVATINPSPGIGFRYFSSMYSSSSAI